MGVALRVFAVGLPALFRASPQSSAPKPPDVSRKRFRVQSQAPSGPISQATATTGRPSYPQRRRGPDLLDGDTPGDY